MLVNFSVMKLLHRFTVATDPSKASQSYPKPQNWLYYAGLRDAVARVRGRGQLPRVLDIGAGTGLLSMMAASLGAAVTACEVGCAFGDLIKH